MQFDQLRYDFLPVVLSINSRKGVFLARKDVPGHFRHHHLSVNILKGRAQFRFLKGDSHLPSRRHSYEEVSKKGRVSLPCGHISEKKQYSTITTLRYFCMFRAGRYYFLLY